MSKWHRRLTLQLLTSLRASHLRRPIIRLLATTHSTSYHLISFFASPDGIHPKHAIQNYHRFFIDHVQESDTVLDIGCGDGSVAFDVAARAKKVVGIDIDAPNITIAQKRFSRPNMSFTVGDATTYPFAESFDVIILSNVLEHIKDRITFLQKAARIAPRLLIRVPMLTRDWLAVYKKNEGLEYRLDDTHYIEYDDDTFRAEMKAAGLTVAEYNVRFGEIYAVVTR